jgi:hypothetical protein
VIKVADFKQLAPNLIDLNPTRDIGLEKKTECKIKGPPGARQILISLIPLGNATY